ncbi:uncharacterized protein DUF1801 [Nitrospirillum pindoramense]|uniref:Uncharacterized protein DUF1801 n=2 Tax=Nitrospirillum amazonense TaxID=28077 RepID=A0A560HFU9_9PROT|nr:uncharacterized protein DUF1801 [Nitrospirillum amazonense]
MVADSAIASTFPAGLRTLTPMDVLFRLPGAARRDPEVDAWFAQGDPLRLMIQPWFEALRGCGPDVRDLIHDRQPTACVGDAAFAYVGAYTAHASVGFFHGADLDDPTGLLQGTGKRMRHVKLRWGQDHDAVALRALIAAAYQDIRRRLQH